MMETQQHRGRSSSAGRQSDPRIRHSPSPQNRHNQSLPSGIPTTSTNFTAQPFDSNISSTAGTSLQYGLSPSYMNGSVLQPQFQQHVLPSNDFGDQIGQSYQQGGLDARFGQDPSHINGPQEGPQYHTDPLGLGVNLPDFRQQQGFDVKQEQSYENSFLVDPQLDTPQQNHINPADIMSNMSSPPNTNPTPPSLMPPDAHSSGPASPIANQGQQWSPHHSRHASLDPSAAFTNGHQSAEWSGMLTGSQFQNHRRAPSEHSDVSSSVGPSPYLAQQDSFDAFEQNPSPMLNPQQDDHLYQNGLNIESFTLSETQQQRHSPRHSPFVSPRMPPQPGLGLASDTTFMTLSQANNSFNGGPGSELYTNNQAESFPPFRPEERLGSNDMGQAAQMVPPEINVEYAPTTRQQNFEPPRYEQSDMDALSPPERGDFALFHSEFLLTNNEPRSKRAYARQIRYQSVFTTGDSQLYALDLGLPRLANRLTTSISLAIRHGLFP